VCVVICALRPSGNRFGSVVATGAQWIPLGARLPPRPSILATRSRFRPDDSDVMSHRLCDNGAYRFLSDYGLSTTAIATWICHPRHPQIVASLDSPNRLSQRSVIHSRKSVTISSSTSILEPLQRAIAILRLPAGWGVMLAIGRESAQSYSC
jgi:predicted naringenin-chalcone synthase